jgi:transcriptional regulator with XRE-family HTH domain
VAKRMLSSLATRLKELRVAAGMSQQSLAVAAGLSVSLVSQIEQGARSDPRISTTAALARALGVTLDDLVSEGVFSTHSADTTSSKRAAMLR